MAGRGMWDLELLFGGVVFVSVARLLGPAFLFLFLRRIAPLFSSDRSRPA